MFDLIQKGIDFVSLEDVNDTDVSDGLMELSWEQVSEMLMTHEHKMGKGGRCFIPAKFKPQEQWTLSDNDKEPSYRHDGNVESISMAVLDLDEPGARETAEEIFADFEYVLYSTHSYTKETPYKFRIALKLDEPIPAEDWPEHFKSLIAPIAADRRCGNLSRVFYFPSHSPKAEIRPHVHHNSGKVLTVEDINSIRETHEASLTPEELEEYRRQNGSNEVVDRGKRHFSGNYISHREISNREIDYSYEGMKKQFSKFLPILVDEDNRHEFALRVSGSGISRWGDKSDVFQLIQFMYKASTEFGSKPLTDPTGDTRKELPEMIGSAIKKFAPELIDGPNPAFKDVRAYVKEVVLKVEQLAITGNWQFPTKVRKFNPMEQARKDVVKLTGGDIDNSLEGWRSRHMGSLKEFVRNGDLVGLAKKVGEQEFSENGERTNINVFGQFLFYCARGYASQVKKTENLNDDLAQALDLLESNVSSYLPREHASEQNSAFMKTACKIARISAVKNEWRFGPKTEPESDSSLNM